MAISDFLVVVQAAQQELAAAGQRIAQLEQTRREVVAQPPHTDDIVDALRRGLDAAQTSFVKRLGFYLNDDNAARPESSSTVANAAAQILNVPAQLPSRQWSTLFHDQELSYNSPSLDTAAVTFFLRDRIETEIPRLVEQLCPASRNGVRHADRQARLAEIDEELGALRADRDRMAEELGLKPNQRVEAERLS